MQNSKDNFDNSEVEHKSSQIHNGQIIVSAVAGLTSGFIIAIYLGAFSGKDYQNLSNWAAVLVSAVATSISIYAVYLVGQTLQATRATLETTQVMAADARQVGNAQTRPWILVSNCEVSINLYEEETAIIHIKNYGNTPARFINIDTHLWGSMPNGEGTQEIKTFPRGHRHYLAPGQEITIWRNIDGLFRNRLEERRMGLNVVYTSILDDNSYEYQVNFEFGADDADNTTIHLI